MNSFNEREKTFESKFARDQETNFKVMARRNRLLGNWAAEKLGLEGSDADAYSKQVVKADFEQPGDEDVFEKVWSDFRERDVDVSEETLREQMKELLVVAREMIANE